MAYIYIEREFEKWFISDDWRKDETIGDDNVWCWP